MKITRYENAIFGLRPIIEAIQAGKEIDTLFIQKGLKNELFQELWQLVRAHKVNYKHVPVEKLNRLTRKNHQGVFAFISPISFHKTDSIVQEVFENGETPLFLILDRITDVRNFGAIARSAVAMGVNGILIPTKNAAQINADSIKTSAGALTQIPVVRMTNFTEGITYLQSSGCKVMACTEKGTQKINKIDLRDPLALVFGSEDDGIDGSILKFVDYHITIPMFGKMSSLNVSVATSISLSIYLIEAY
jgi:23S rRNA (guanosine2251-2'-O)-methyltransferase